MKIKNIEHECELFAKKMMEFNPNVMIEFNVYNTNEMAADLETPGDRMQNIMDRADYMLLWYQWMTYKCPTAQEQNTFNKMNKQQKYDYLKEKVNENK